MLLEHLYVVLVALVYPVVGYFSFKRLMRRVAAGEPVDRAQLYQLTIAGHWLLFALLLVLWYVSGRSFETLGYAPMAGTGFIAGAALTVIGIVFLLLQLRHVMNASNDTLKRYASQFGDVGVIVPQNGNELARFYALSVTAGVVEEAVWRGFLIWYLALYMPLWAAALLSIIGFTLGHAYQGTANLPKITLISAALTGLYLLSGSLWLPMLLHAAVDILQGRLGYEVLHRTSLDDDADAANGAVPA